MTTAANPANWLTGTIAELPTPLDAAGPLAIRAISAETARAA
jgi:hypothetical protein